MNAMERIFSATAQLPSIPAVVQKMIDTLQSEDSDLHPLIAEIRTDPVISARVLRLANSGFYSSRRSIGSVDDAVTLIGTRALRTLVISAGISGAFPKVPGVNMQDFWRHALMTASANSLLASASESARRTIGDGSSSSMIIAPSQADRSLSDMSE